MHMAEVMTLVW